MSATPEPAEPVALEALHSRLGGRARVFEGFELPGSYGNVEAERRALEEGCGLVDRSWLSRLEVRGADRLRFVNGLVTSNVGDLEPGEACYGFFTSREGRILADVYALALQDRLWLELPPGRGATITEHLEKYIVIDDVEVCSLEALLPITVLGPEAVSFLARLGELPEGDHRHLRTTLLGTELQAGRRRLFGVESFTLWVSESIGDLFVGELLEAGAGAVRPCGIDALEALRVEAGVGRFGQDFDDENLPHESGLLEEAVDFEKGCYLGQEIVARLHYKGRAARRSCGLEVQATHEPQVGTAVLLEDRPCGSLTSVVRSLRDDHWCALGMLEREALEEAVELRLEGGGRVRHAEDGA